MEPGRGPVPVLLDPVVVLGVAPGDLLGLDGLHALLAALAEENKTGVPAGQRLARGQHFEARAREHLADVRLHAPLADLGPAAALGVGPPPLAPVALDAVAPGLHGREGEPRVRLAAQGVLGELLGELELGRREDELEPAADDELAPTANGALVDRVVPAVGAAEVDRGPAIAEGVGLVRPGRPAAPVPAGDADAVVADGRLGASEQGLSAVARGDRHRRAFPRVNPTRAPVERCTAWATSGSSTLRRSR